MTNILGLFQPLLEVGDSFISLLSNKTMFIFRIPGAGTLPFPSLLLCLESSDYT
jgi:hypothetical protein